MEKEKTLQERMQECAGEIDTSLKKFGLGMQYFVFIPPKKNGKAPWIARTLMNIVGKYGAQVVARMYELPKQQ